MRRSLLLVAVAFASLGLPASASAAFGPLSSIGSFGTGAGQIDEQGNLEVTAAGRVYNADYGSNRVNVFTTEGSFLFAFGDGVAPGGADVCTTATGCLPGGEGEAGAAIEDPEGVALDPAGNVYVAPNKDHRIAVFTSEGAFLYAFGKGVNAGPGDPDVCTTECTEGEALEESGGISSPHGIAVVAGDVFVADQGNRRVDVFTTGGEFLYAFGREVNAGLGNPDVCTTECRAGAGSAPEVTAAGSIANPTDVQVGPGGLLAVGDAANHRIAVFTEEGEFVRAFGIGVNPGPGDPNVCETECQAGATVGGGGFAPGGVVSSPVSLAFDSAGTLYFGDSDADRVSQFTLDGGFIRAFGQGVIDGSAAFQVCTAASGCRAGIVSQSPGSISNPYGLGIDRCGSIYAGEESENFARIERFGETGTGFPPSCILPAAPISAPAPSNKFKFGKLKLNKKKGTATLLVTVPGPGKVVLKGKGIKKVAKSAKKAGSVSLPVKPTGKAKRTLNETGRAKLKAKVTFTPTGGAPLTKTHSLTLKKTFG